MGANGQHAQQDLKSALLLKRHIIIQSQARAIEVMQEIIHASNAYTYGEQSIKPLGAGREANTRSNGWCGTKVFLN